MAVVGGLVLSMSATFAREGDKVRPQILFHTGRIVSFFILGGVIGALGSAFTLGPTGMFVLGLLVGIVMLILGINLLDVFPWAQTSATVYAEISRQARARCVRDESRAHTTSRRRRDVLPPLRLHTGDAAL